MAIKFSLLGLLVICLWNCAQQVPPSGGKKDIHPPVVIEEKSNPLNETTNFKNSKIDLHFDEFITLKSPKEQILINPSIGDEVEYLVKGKKLHIILPNRLNENTTYVINFGESVRDYTEGNILKNYQYIFSTGSFIDSLKIKGSIKNSWGKSSLDNILVMLYKDFNDSIPLKKKPDYFTRTDKQGNFELGYIKSGTYKTVCVKDENKNYLFDQGTEEIGFLAAPITIDSHENLTLDFVIFKEKEKKQFIEKQKYEHPGKLLLLPKVKSLTTVLNHNAGSTDPKLTEYSKHHDTIIYWLKPEELETSSKSIVFHDPEFAFSDTVSINIKKPKKDTKNNIKLLLKAASEYHNWNPIEINSNYPLFSLDPSKIRLSDDKGKNIRCTPKISGPRRIKIDANLKEGKPYTLSIDSGAVSSYNGIIQDSLALILKVTPESNYGQLNLTLESDLKEPKILYLLKNEKITDTIYFNEAKFEKSFNNLSAGQYDLLLITDKNKNGAWDTGDYFKKLQPEPVHRYNQPIEIKKGWDAAVIWQIKP